MTFFLTILFFSIAYFVLLILNMKFDSAIITGIFGTIFLGSLTVTSLIYKKNS